MSAADSPDPVEVMARGIYEQTGHPFKGGRRWEDALGASQRNARKRARAALSALEKAGYAVVPGWQDISTAPHDGTEVLLSWQRGAVLYGIALWYQGCWCDQDESTLRGSAPTHWMPLPAPKGAAGAADRSTT